MLKCKVLTHRYWRKSKKCFFLKIILDFVMYGRMCAFKRGGVFCQIPWRLIIIMRHAKLLERVSISYFVSVIQKYSLTIREAKEVAQTVRSAYIVTIHNRRLRWILFIANMLNSKKLIKVKIIDLIPSNLYL